MNDQTHLEDLTDRIRPRAASTILLWGILAFFVVFIAWAALVELDRQVRAQGRVIPSSRLQVVSNLEGGIVEEILVGSGDVVEQGDPLVRLDQTQTGAALGSGQAEAIALAAKVARLEAEVAGREPRYPAPRDASSAEQIAIERSLHASRLADLASLTSAARARINQAQAAYRSRVTARESARAELEMIRPLVERGIEPRLTLVQLESTAAQAASDAAAAQAAVAEATASLRQQRQDWRAQAAAELAAAQAQYAAARQSLPALADRVDRTTVEAPLDGRINRVLVTTVGGTVAPGEPIVEIVPSEETLMVEALVLPKDIAFVRIGQPARINISAYDSAIYGSLDGNVVSISPDATVNEQTGESFYTVRVRTSGKGLRGADGQILEIGPGMTADVNLLGDKRSVLDYILTPITRLGQTAFRE